VSARDPWKSGELIPMCFGVEKDAVSPPEASAVFRSAEPSETGTGAA
jgi:hypothetical protein